MVCYRYPAFTPKRISQQMKSQVGQEVSVNNAKRQKPSIPPLPRSASREAVALQRRILGTEEREYTNLIELAAQHPKRVTLVLAAANTLLLVLLPQHCSAGGVQRLAQIYRLFNQRERDITIEGYVAAIEANLPTVPAEAAPDLLEGAATTWEPVVGDQARALRRQIPSFAPNGARVVPTRDLLITLHKALTPQASQPAANA